MEPLPSPARPSPARPSPERIDSWVFDLDNTLYPASCDLFSQIDLRMRRFIAEALHLPLDQAFALQKRYYRQYGTTLRGLMLAHGIEPESFLAYVHDIDHSPVVAAPRLQQALARLPGRKIVFTNGSERHAVKVLERLGLSGVFDGIFDIKAAGWIPKPDANAYARMVARHGVRADRAAMFEDLPRNLLPAARIGMTTVWVKETGQAHWTDEESADLSHIHHITDDLAGWLAALTVTAE